MRKRLKGTRKKRRKNVERLKQGGRDVLLRKRVVGMGRLETKEVKGGNRA